MSFPSARLLRLAAIVFLVGVGHSYWAEASDAAKRRCGEGADVAVNSPIAPHRSIAELTLESWIAQVTSALDVLEFSHITGGDRGEAKAMGGVLVQRRAAYLDALDQVRVEQSRINKAPFTRPTEELEGRIAEVKRALRLQAEARNYALGLRNTAADEVAVLSRIADVDLNFYGLRRLVEELLQLNKNGSKTHIRILLPPDGIPDQQFYYGPLARVIDMNVERVSSPATGETLRYQFPELSLFEARERFFWLLAATEIFRFQGLFSAQRMMEGFEEQVGKEEGFRSERLQAHWQVSPHNPAVGALTVEVAGHGYRQFREPNTYLPIIGAVHSGALVQIIP